MRKVNNLKKILATFTDKHGTEKTTIYSDGHSLRMTLRGVLFEDICFDGFEAVEQSSSELLNQFDFQNGMLLFSKLEISIPLIVQNKETESTTWLHGTLEPASLVLKLELEKKTVLSMTKDLWFEENMLSIQKQLDVDEYMKCCFNCQYADYSYGGSDMFGTMFCFRNIKEKYLKVISKDDYVKIFEEYEMQMQETHFCSEFERRFEGVGYRG